MIVTVKPRNGQETSYVGKSEGSYVTFPMVCLVNGYSASAAARSSRAVCRITAAIIMGSLAATARVVCRSIMNFPTTGGQLKVTTATLPWRPSG